MQKKKRNVLPSKLRPVKPIQKYQNFKFFKKKKKKKKNTMHPTKKISGIKTSFPQFTSL